MSRGFIHLKAMLCEEFDDTFDWHGVDIAQLQDTGDEGCIIIRVQQGDSWQTSGINSAFTGIIVLVIDMLDKTGRNKFVADAICRTYFFAFFHFELCCIRIDIMMAGFQIKIFFASGSVVPSFFQTGFYFGYDCRSFIGDRDLFGFLARYHLSQYADFTLLAFKACILFQQGFLQREDGTV